MIQFIQTIANLIVAIGSLIIHLITSIINIIVYTTESVSGLIIGIAWLPSFIQGYVLAFLAIAVLKFILSHGSNQ